MKYIYKLSIVLFIGIIGISFMIPRKAVSKYTYNDVLYNSYNSIDDNVTAKEEVSTNEVEEPIESDVQSSVETKTAIKAETTKPVVKEETIKTETSIETFTGSISGYGYDCYGCTSGRTASGYDITNGNIYYTDNTYGKIRILSGDSKYPFGTIVKISNFLNEGSFYAIVLDRGSDIGLSKRIQFDLVYPSNGDAKSLGIQKNVTFDIIRLGY